MSTLNQIVELVRIENTPKAEYLDLCQSKLSRMYPHHELHGEHCSLQEFVACPPEAVFNYLAQTESLLEWTYSLRNLTPTEKPGLVMFGDKIGGATKCYCRTESDSAAMTVDYHCAWDQSDELWMIYYMRVIDAHPVLNQAGSIVTWTNCCHPYYKENPFPELAAPDRSVWVGDGWSFFYAGHQMELTNLKRILEYRKAEGISLTDLSHLK
ncbi:MAG: hypothetical protein KUG82_02190 [Pseudomonadales bacterium]|nr:hypothetical protein [Pseudomonadales bacterium]